MPSSRIGTPPAFALSPVNAVNMSINLRRAVSSHGAASFGRAIYDPTRPLRRHNCNRCFLDECCSSRTIRNVSTGEEVVNDGVGVQPRNSTTLRSEEHTSELQSRGHLVCR